MSKNYLTTEQAYTKLGLIGGGNNKNFITKATLLKLDDINQDKLAKYGLNDFVVDDIEISMDLLIIVNYSGTPSDSNAVILDSRMRHAFNPYKSFKIKVTVTQLSYGFTRVLTIHSQTIAGTPREIQIYGDTTDGGLAFGVYY